MVVPLVLHTLAAQASSRKWICGFAASARLATGKSPPITRAPEWPDLSSSPPSANTIEDYAKAPEYYHALSDSHYAMTIRNGRVLPAPLATGRRRQGDQCRRNEDRLCDGFGKSCPLLPAPDRARNADRVAAGLVSGQGRRVGHGSRLRHRTSADAPVRLLQVHVLPQRLPADRRREQVAGQRAGVRRANCPTESIASDATVRAPSTSAPAAGRAS